MAANSRDTLRDKLSRGEKVIATFTVLRGARNAQVLAHTGVDVSWLPLLTLAVRVMID
jgi:hypothetical protein